MTKTTSETNKASTTTNANKRRKRVAMRFFTYGAMAVATVIGVIICIGWAMGYRFDLQNGLSQVALLQFNTFPTGASVDVNDERLTARTPTRSNVKTGETTVRMSRSGYRDWRKTVAALPSTVSKSPSYTRPMMAESVVGPWRTRSVPAVTTRPAPSGRSSG